jgi:hypothetical protein
MSFGIGFLATSKKRNTDMLLHVSGYRQMGYNKVENFIARTNPKLAQRMYETRMRKESVVVKPSPAPGPVIPFTPVFRSSGGGGGSSSPPKEESSSTTKKPVINPVSTMYNSFEAAIARGNPAMARSMYEKRTGKTNTLINKGYTPRSGDVQTAPGAPITKGEGPTYGSINNELNKAKAQILTSNLSINEKQQKIKDINTQQRQIKEYESRGFGVKEVMMPGELEPGQMGPPAPVKGYEFTVPERVQLDWARYQTKQANKLPPVIREITQFGQGISSSLYSVVSPVAGLFGKQKEFNIMTSISMARGSSLNPFDTKDYGKNLAGALEAGKYGVYYPSTLDFALEPIGMAPKGTIDFLKENPAFAAGGVGGEVAQWVVGGEIIKYGSIAVKVGTRMAIPKAGSMVTKITPKVERIFGKAFPEFTTRLGKTTVGKNVVLFGKGYEPVSKGFEKIVASKSSRLVEEGTTVTRIERAFKQVPKRQFGFAERTFVEKSTQKSLLKPVQEITTIMRPAQKEAGLLVEKTTYKSGVRGIVRKYSSVNVVSRGGKTYIESGLKSKFGSLYNLQRDVKPMLQSEFDSLVKSSPKLDWYYNTVIPHWKGLGIPSRAVQTVKRSFVKGTEAVGSLGRTISETRVVSTGGRVAGNISREVIVNVPVSRVGVRLGELGAYGVSRISEHGTINEPILINYKPPVTTQKNISSVVNVTVPVQEQKKYVDVFPIQKVTQVTDRITIDKQVQIQIPVQEQRWYQSDAIRQRQVNEPFTEMIYPFIPGFPLKISGRGARGWDWRHRQDEYKFRKAKIGLPFKLGKGGFKEFKL